MAAKYRIKPYSTGYSIQERKGLWPFRDWCPFEHAYTIEEAGRMIAKRGAERALKEAQARIHKVAFRVKFGRSLKYDGAGNRIS